MPINLLVQVPGTPLHGIARFDPLELVRTIAAARLMMPESVVRLSLHRLGTGLAVLATTATTAATVVGV